MQRNHKGFTLMELMVVIVIVAILAAVAVPLYINYVKDAQRTEAKGAIGAIITAEQTYLQANGGYTTNALALNVDLSDVSHNWTITIPSADAKCQPNQPCGFTVQAAGILGRPTDGLSVTCVYTRGAAPVWTEK